jgi:hypothetical protein
MDSPTNTSGSGRIRTSLVFIDGLWPLAFGNDGNAGPATTLYFTAGLDSETHGLFGTLTRVPSEEDGSIE